MGYLVHYEYGPDRDHLNKIEKAACFGSLFRSLITGIFQNMFVRVYMYPKWASLHNLSFGKEDVDYIYSKLAHITDVPVVEKTNNGLTLEFSFQKRTSGHIKTIITLCRYFFEYNAKEEKGIKHAEKQMSF